jgi:hypothetical protein
VIAYRAMLDVPRELVWKLAALLRAERRARGTRNGTRLLTCLVEPNYSTQATGRDTGRGQNAQVGHQKAFAITKSTGLRRRERRFESCRGHHA